MALPAPAWHSLLEGIPQLNTVEARQDLSNNVRHIEQTGNRVILTTYGSPRVALVSIRDVALLRILDEHPELKQHVESLLPT